MALSSNLINSMALHSKRKAYTIIKLSLHMGAMMKILISFFLCLTGTLTLTACAQPASTPVTKQVEVKKELAQPVETVAPKDTQDMPSSKETKPMIDLDNPPRGPAIPVAELKKQILALIGSLQSREDTNQENVEKHLGVKMYVDPEWDMNRMYWGQTTEGWMYWFSVTKLRDEPASSIDFRFFHGEQPLDDALPKTCTLSFEELAKDIVAMGYNQGSKGPNAFTEGNKVSGFSKDVLGNKIGFGIGLHVYRADNGTEDGHFFCIKSIDIDHEMKP